MKRIGPLRPIAAAVLLFSACGGAPPPAREEPQTCDDFDETAIETRREPGALVIEQRVTGGHCTTQHSTVHPVGRIVLSATEDATCPVGVHAFRAWGGNEVAPESEGFAARLSSEALAELRAGLRQFAQGEIAFAYVLGCPSPHEADYVFIAWRGGELRRAVFVGNRLAHGDPRFVTPEGPP